MISSTFFTITIAFNHTLAFSPSEEIDYSMPFEFESYSDLPMGYSDVEEFTNFTMEPNDHALSDNKLSDMRNKTQSESIQDKEHVDRKLNEKFGMSPLINSDRSIQSERTENDTVGPQMKIDDTKPELEEFSVNPKMNEDKIAIINFDDNWRSQYQYAKPILDKFQFKATFYVVCDYIDNKNRISWDELQNLYSEGHEIGSHTMSHANLDNIMMDGVHNEIIESKKCIEDRGIKVNSFAYPFNSGDDNLEILDLVSNNYEFARTAGGDLNDDIGSESDSLKRYTIVGWSHDAERKKHSYSDSEMLQEFKEYVNEYNKEDDKGSHIPIIIYHKIGDMEDDVYSTSIDLFESEMRYLYENGFKVITMDKVFGKI